MDRLIKLNTERLYVMPLNEDKLELCINNYEKLERSLKFKVTNRKLKEKQKDVYNIRLKGLKSDPQNYMWSTVWLIVLRDENRIIGNIMIKGYPNENGEVIIGYSMEDGYKCRGYMTEALNRIITYIFENPNVEFIVADTLKDNTPSHKVLVKVGMVKYKEDEECYWWRLGRNKMLRN